METIRIGLELRVLNNLIWRYFECASHKTQVRRITGSNGWIIGYLAENAGRDIYQKDLEGHFSIARSTASRVLSLMEQKGLIQRQAVAHDARLKKIVLTEKAWKIKEVMWEDGRKMNQTLIEGFSDEEVETLYSYIQRMKANISEY